ncbi:MAG: hypothetical protein ABI887_00585 [Burkholderiales bacterium]
MLQLTPEQEQALEGVERTLLLQRLGAHLALRWPTVAERLGARLPAFVEHAMQAAERHGLRIALGAVRYVNLCFVWGTGFEDKPGFEWARDTLADPKRHEWQKVHQLVRRSVDALATRKPPLPSATALTETDDGLMQAFARLGLLGRLLLREGVELPRVACDLDVAGIRVTDTVAAQIYQLTPAGPVRAPAPAAPPPLRVDMTQPAWPARIAVLARPADVGAATRLQLRTVTHAVCDGDWHPHIAYAGAHGVWEWRGAEARAVSWPLTAALQTSAAAELGIAIGEASPPEIARLQLTTCALREEGLPLGGGTLQVWIHPASQWLFTLQRAGARTLSWPRAEHAPGVTELRIERDGDALASEAWRRGFDALDELLQTAVDRLGAAWERSAGIERAQVSAELAVLGGSGALTWGWQQPASFAEPARMRVAAELDMQALNVMLECRGELHLGGARALLRLRAAGSAPLRVQAEPVGEPMAGAVSRFRIPFTLELDALATSEAAVLNVDGPCLGALVGEAGLRPRLEGGSGWQWYVLMRVEAVSVPLTLHDPVLGQTRQPCVLLPEMPLLAWSLG